MPYHGQKYKNKKNCKRFLPQKSSQTKFTCLSYHGFKHIKSYPPHTIFSLHLLNYLCIDSFGFHNVLSVREGLKLFCTTPIPQAPKRKPTSEKLRFFWGRVYSPNEMQL